MPLFLRRDVADAATKYAALANGAGEFAPLLETVAMALAHKFGRSGKEAIASALGLMIACSIRAAMNLGLTHEQYQSEVQKVINVAWPTHGRSLS